MRPVVMRMGANLVIINFIRSQQHWEDLVETAERRMMAELGGIDRDRILTSALDGSQAARLKWFYEEFIASDRPSLSICSRWLERKRIIGKMSNPYWLVKK